MFPHIISKRLNSRLQKLPPSKPFPLKSRPKIWPKFVPQPAPAVQLGWKCLCWPFSTKWLHEAVCLHSNHAMIPKGFHVNDNNICEHIFINISVWKFMTRQDWWGCVIIWPQSSGRGQDFGRWSRQWKVHPGKAIYPIKDKNWLKIGKILLPESWPEGFKDVDDLGRLWKVHPWPASSFHAYQRLRWPHTIILELCAASQIKHNCIHSRSTFKWKHCVLDVVRKFLLPRNN